jgi:hypothetical protein
LLSERSHHLLVTRAAFRVDNPSAAVIIAVAGTPATAVSIWRSIIWADLTLDALEQRTSIADVDRKGSQ